MKSNLFRLKLLLAIVVVLLVSFYRLDFALPAKAQDPLPYKAYLPIIFHHQPCLANAQAEEIAQKMKDDPRQERASMTCNDILAQVAQARAEDMAQRNYFGHTTPEGYGPNYLVRQAGYVLPSYYGSADDANNIESIAAGYSTANQAWTKWMESQPHREHLLGLHSFYADQIEYGIGYVYNPDSQYRHYWVVFTAKPGP
ncbi:MAG TPA: hypothetical protein G4N96_06385 [Chloroflexi bacterium]|nr:hypothetical protein [Chloroflexota bacterium]